MADRINARVDDELARKIAYIRRSMKMSTTDVVTESIGHYYHTLKSAGSRAREVLCENGFIGCADGPEDLSIMYKNELSDSIAEKI